VHKLHQVVQPIVRRISETELCESLQEQRTILKHQHKCGPDIEGRPDLLQYGGTYVGRTHISSDRKKTRETAVLQLTTMFVLCRTYWQQVIQMNCM